MGVPTQFRHTRKRFLGHFLFEIRSPGQPAWKQRYGSNKLVMDPRIAAHTRRRPETCIQLPALRIVHFASGRAAPEYIAHRAPSKRICPGTVAEAETEGRREAHRVGVGRRVVRGGKAVGIAGSMWPSRGCVVGGREAIRKAGGSRRPGGGGWPAERGGLAVWDGSAERDVEAELVVDLSLRGVRQDFVRL